MGNMRRFGLVLPSSTQGQGVLLQKNKAFDSDDYEGGGKKSRQEKKYLLFQCRPSEYWTPCIEVPAGAPLTRGGSERDGSGTIPGIAGAAY